MQSRIICQREPLLPLAQMGGFYVPLLILEAGFPRAPGSGGGGATPLPWKRGESVRGVSECTVVLLIVNRSLPLTTFLL